jgi:hypothetical protein
MPLEIETFSNAVGGNAFYKAISHPLAAPRAQELLAALKAAGPVAIFDPHALAPAFDALFPLEGVEIAGLYVQDVGHIGRRFRGATAQPVTELRASKARALFIAGFDAAPVLQRLRLFLPADLPVHSFDSVRLPDDMLTDRARYLSTLNFATNFVFFRDEKGHHTRLTTVNYWANYGGKGGYLWFVLFDGAGRERAAWREDLPVANGAIVIDSAEIRRRFALPEFAGQLFVHVVGAAGHDIVKYALDTYGDTPDVLSCTHDANSWPADRYAGLPAPAAEDDVVLWVQNSHAAPIPAGEIGLNVMGDEKIAWLDRPVAGFASHPVRVSELLPQARWPQQIEIRAGKHVVRPRYEVVKSDGRRNMAHPNVERQDLKPDPKLPQLRDLLGKGFLLPAPVLPQDRFRTLVLPTPMALSQRHLPVKLLVHDANGEKLAERSFGNLARRDSVALDLGEVLGNQALPSGYGHMELVYDFDAGDEADGWLHALFRYEDRRTQHQAETSFGAHVFNTLTTYKDEPQSYKGPPPGLTTRLFLRVGPKPLRTMCHLIYAASRPWHALSDTALILTSAQGAEVAKTTVRIPCGGSLLWHVDEMFSAAELADAGAHCHVVVRDATCRLFGYHGLVSDPAFSLDHMFGF